MSNYSITESRDNSLDFCLLEFLQHFSTHYYLKQVMETRRVCAGISCKLILILLIAAVYYAALTVTMNGNSHWILQEIQTH